MIKAWMMKGAAGSSYQPETLAYQTRVLADGGTIVSLAHIDAAVVWAKANGCAWPGTYTTGLTGTKLTMGSAWADIENSSVDFTGSIGKYLSILDSSGRRVGGWIQPATTASNVVITAWLFADVSFEYENFPFSYLVTTNSIDYLQPWYSAQFAYKDAGSGKVSKWYDLSRYNNDAIQATSGLQPTWTASQDSGRAALLFNGANGIDIPDAIGLNFGTADFTIDMLMNLSAVGQLYDSVVFHKANAADRPTPVMINNVVASYNVKLMMSVSNNGDLINAVQGTLTQNAYTRLTICRVGANVYSFINGNMTNSGNPYNIGALVSLLGNSYPFRLGSGNYVSCYLTGAIEYIRILKGVGLWTSNFTP